MVGSDGIKGLDGQAPGEAAQALTAILQTQYLRYLIIETAFSNKEQDLARTAKHLYPVQLGQELEKLRVEPQVLITHLKPSDRAVIEQEIMAWAGRFRPVILRSGVIIGSPACWPVPPGPGSLAGHC